MTSITRFIQISGTQYGALVIYDSSEGETATIYVLDSQGNKGQPYYSQVIEHETDDGETVYAAVFPALPPGNYITYEPGYTSFEKRVTVFPGSIAEVKYT